ncbi:hypothetical protein RJT34_15998 [Clitoria ternatea]|uniref:Uncharacterized protein n=1 Tax=Clitoria ternatea TaxID=43366 RepID=A0AAN9J6N4_CLITE
MDDEAEWDGYGDMSYESSESGGNYMDEEDEYGVNGVIEIGRVDFEKKADYHLLKGTPVLQSPLPLLEKSACLTYTRRFSSYSELPDNLILLRWRKSVKEMVVGKNQATLMFLESQTISRNAALVYSSRKVYNLACKTEEDFNEYLDKFISECRHVQSKHIEGSGEVEVGNVDVQ